MNPAFPFWMGSVLVIAASLLVFIFIKEPKTYEESEKHPGMLESLRTVMQDSDKSALRLLLAIFFWFLGYTAIEAFFTLYAKNHLGLEEADGARLLGQLSLFFVIFALPSGYIGGKFGRRVTIVSGIVLMSLTMLAMFFVPPATLTIQLTKLPVLGVVPVLGVLLMTAGAAWALININSLAAVMDGQGPCETPGEVAARLQSVFADGESGVTFSTVHQAKGLEAERVFIARPDLMPLARVRQEWELQQELNIEYVAYTRSKSELYFLEGSE